MRHQAHQNEHIAVAAQREACGTERLMQPQTVAFDTKALAPAPALGSQVNAQSVFPNANLCAFRICARCRQSSTAHSPPAARRPAEPDLCLKAHSARICWL